jgi:hypothetical protein
LMDEMLRWWVDPFSNRNRHIAATISRRLICVDLVRLIDTTWSLPPIPNTLCTRFMRMYLHICPNLHTFKCYSQLRILPALAETLYLWAKARGCRSLNIYSKATVDRLGSRSTDRSLSNSILDSWDLKD